MSKFPPDDRAALLKLLYCLGFIEKLKTGRKRHPIKLVHPLRKPSKTNCSDQPPFIIIPYKVNENQIRYVLKEVKCWGFSEKDMEKAL